MSKYIIKRVLLIIPTVLIVCAIVFILMRMLPGSAVDALLYKMRSSGTYDVTRENVEAILGMDKPAVIQFFVWLWDAVRGNLGNCIFQSETVIGAIGRQLPVSLELGILTLILTNIISIPLGLWCAARQDTVSDYSIRVLSMVLMAMPLFWLATLVLIYPAIWWKWSPLTQYVGFLKNPLQNIKMFIVPALLGAITQTGMQLRTVRTVMLGTMRTGYVRTAWAKGAPERRVMFRHGFRNAMIPVITLIGGSIGGLVGGSVIMENIFNLPGIGQQVMLAISSRDYPLVQGCILIFSFFTMAVNLVVDVSYKLIDPRVSLSGERREGA